MVVGVQRLTYRWPAVVLFLGGGGGRIDAGPIVPVQTPRFPKPAIEPKTIYVVRRVDEGHSFALVEPFDIGAIGPVGGEDKGMVYGELSDISVRPDPQSNRQVGE